MKIVVALSSLCLLPLFGIAQPTETVEAFDLQDIRLLEGPFKQAEQVDMRYILEMDMDRLLAPFLSDAGLQPKKESYPNWESTGLDGHIAGHYLSALSMMYASTGDKRMKERLDYMVSELKRAQEKNKNGYVGGVPNGKILWQEIKNGNIRASGFDLNNRWVPLYNIHKTYAGLRDASILGENEDARKMLIDLTDWMLDMVADLSDEQVQDMLRSEHGGLNETFADVAEMTGQNKYMKLARRFSQQSLLEPLIRNDDQLNGMHANTQIPKVIGFKRIADLEQDKAWNHAAEFFWDNVTGKRSVSIGGNSVREHFNPPNDYSSMLDSEQGPETCNTYNMLKLTRQLFLSNPQNRYIEFYERALYNHILSTQNPDKGGFVYLTPMRPSHYRVYSQPHTCFWCCVGSGLENHAKYGELIYAHTQDELYVNLFIASAIRWKEKNLVLTQQTRFPDEAKTAFTVQSEKPTEFTLKLRYPEWVKPGSLRATVNGIAVDIHSKPGEYIAIERTWKTGDTVAVELPMHIEAEQLPDNSNYYSFRYGPIVLAAKTGTDHMEGLFANDSRGGHIAVGKKWPLNKMPILTGEASSLAGQVKPTPGKPLTFTIENLVSSSHRNLQLIPFFRLHESRYIVYWRNESAADIESIQAQFAAEAAEQQRLDAITIDLVYPGEQQPESDHFVDSKESKTGLFQGRHWRDATGWFSYILQDKNREAKHLRVTYYGLDTDRHFKVLINGEVVATEKLNGSHGDTFFTVGYVIPQTILKSADGVFTIKFQAEKDSVAGGCYEVRLIK